MALQRDGDESYDEFMRLERMSLVGEVVAVCERENQAHLTL